MRKADRKWSFIGVLAIFLVMALLTAFAAAAIQSISPENLTPDAEAAVRVENRLDRSVGEAEILAFCGRRFFANEKKTFDVNTRRVLTRKFSKQ